MTASTASAIVVDPAERRPTALASTHTGRSVGWWGLVWLVATEATLFGLLLFGNFYLRANAPQWPPEGVDEPEMVLSGIRTALLLGSSLPAFLAERAGKRGRRRAMLWWLATTWLMGAVFLAGHIQEWAVLWKDLKPSSNAYGSVFYTITGFHAAHLAVGLIIVAYLWFRGLRGRYVGERTEPLEIGLWYWHFVDVVWIAVYSSLYVSVALR
jgi:heme/copper-type cytochrome/quinol oxidase subunit 3